MSGVISKQESTERRRSYPFTGRNAYVATSFSGRGGACTLGGSAVASRRDASRLLTAAMLRYEAGRDPLNEALTTLVGELSTRSPLFRTRWADRGVHEHRSGTKIYYHHEVGELELDYDVLAQPGTPGISITTYSPRPDSPTADRIALLASWTTDLPPVE